MADIDLVTFKCDKCKAEYQISKNVFYSRRRKKLPNYCKACMKEYTNKKKAEHYNNLSPEEKEKYVEKRNWYSRASEEEKEKFKKKMQDIEKAKTPEQKAEENRKNSEGLKKHWATVSEEDKLKRVAPMLDAAHSKWSDMTPEERSEYQKNWYKNLSVKTKEKMTKINRENITKYNNSLTYEEKLEQIQPMLEWQKNLTQEEKDKIYQRRTEEWWNKLTLEEKIEYNHKKFSSTDATSNLLNKKFESLINNSDILKNFKIEKEYLSGDEFHHSWDYALFKDDKLVMLVDLDGIYYHADKCDYDGIRSREEYDEKRGLTAPKDVMIAIIKEDDIIKSFDNMCKMLNLDYNEYINKMFNMYRSIPFPEPRYSDESLCRSYKALQKMKCDDKYLKSISVNTRLGDMLIQHFHPSIYHANRKGRISPFKAWYDDDILMKAIKNRILYQTYLNPNKILQGFNVSKVAPKVSVFSAGRARLLIHRYLNEFDTIFDPFSGFSGRFLGTIASSKRYLGQDISEWHVKESNRMMKFLNDHGINIYDSIINVGDSSKTTGEFPCLLTCSPYADIEQWYDVPVDQRSCDDWIDICLNNFKCKRYVFVVNETKKYRKNIVDAIYNKSAFSKSKEYIIVIDR